MIVSLALDYLGVSIGVGIAALIFLILQKKLSERLSAVSFSIVWIAMACCLLIPIGSLLQACGTLQKTPIDITIPSYPAISTGELNIIPPSEEEATLSEVPITVKTEDAVETAAEESTQTSTTTPINWSYLFVYLWLTGTVLFLAYHVLCHILLCISIRRHSFECPEYIYKELESTKRELSVHRPICIRQYNLCKSPFLIGIFHPMILLPKDLPDSISLEFILQHELTHYKNRDIPIKLLALLANALHFYNPMAYVIRHEIFLGRELICDQNALKNQSDDFVHAYRAIE